MLAVLFVHVTNENTSVEFKEKCNFSPQLKICNLLLSLVIVVNSCVNRLLLRCSVNRSNRREYAKSDCHIFLFSIFI